MFGGTPCHRDPEEDVVKNVLTALFVIIVFMVFAAGAYYVVPVMIEKGTTALKNDVLDLKRRVGTLEEEAKVSPLKPDADVQKIIKTINALSLKQASLEDSFKRSASTTDAEMKKQAATTEEALKKQAEAIDKIAKETEAKIERIRFNALMAAIRGNVLKVKAELLAKNIGTAKNELDLMSDAFDKAKTLSSDEDKKVIDEMQAILRKTRAEVDSDLPAAISRIDLMWHELSKRLMRT
jgi:predicted  nucleic acid-binding Zn-ribbon protein